MKKLLILAFVVFIHQIKAQITLIPDEAFEQELINQNIDSDGIINGQVLTSDISIVETLSFSYNYSVIDITGIEDFEALTFLDITNTALYTDHDFFDPQELDLSQNTNLETLILYGGGDAVTNFVSSINISNNPAINTIHVPDNWYLEQINLKSGGTDVSDLTINIAIGECCPVENFCIKVTDASAANAGEGVYATWTINAFNNPYYFSETCTLNTTSFTESSIAIYPNPTSDFIEIDSNNNELSKIELYTIQGKKMNTYYDFSTEKIRIPMNEFAEGVYLLKIFNHQNNSITKKIVKSGH